MKIAISGANSRVGQTLVQYILDNTGHSIIAGARSLQSLEGLPQTDRVERIAISYSAPEALAQSFSSADCLVHLAGILMEGPNTTYQTANVDATAAVVTAAKNASVAHIVFISVVGAAIDSPNAYFRSKATAERIVSDSEISSSIIRTPILLGPGAAGAQAIKWLASKPKPRLLGGGHYTMRPLDIDDLCVAVLNCCQRQLQGSNVYELVGSQAIEYSELIKMAAAIRGQQVEITSFPIGVAKTAARLRGLFKKGGMSPTVIDVITMNEVVNENADQALGVSLTPLSKTLQKFLTN